MTPEVRAVIFDLDGVLVDSEVPALLEALEIPACLASGSSHERIELSLIAAGLAAGMAVIGFTAGGHASGAWEARLRQAAPTLWSPRPTTWPCTSPGTRFAGGR